MKLYFANEYLGEVSNVSVDGMWVSATITPSKNMAKFHHFFAAIVDEENNFEEDLYPEEWLEDSKWFIVDDQNLLKGIFIPAVYSNYDISWRWR